jgi:hypothetical protein
MSATFAAGRVPASPTPLRRSALPAWVRNLPLLVLTVLVAALGAGCQMVMGPGTFNAKLKGAQLDEVVSLYIVVADDADLADLEDPRTIDKLVRPERQAKYVTFAQLKPTLGATWLFEVKSANPTHKSVKLKPNAKTAEFTVGIDRTLLEARPNLALAVLVNCGPKGWGASTKISKTEIENIGRIELEVRGLAINRVGGK